MTRSQPGEGRGGRRRFGTAAAALIGSFFAALAPCADSRWQPGLNYGDVFFSVDAPGSANLRHFTRGVALYYSRELLNARDEFFSAADFPQSSARARRGDLGESGVGARKADSAVRADDAGDRRGHGSDRRRDSVAVVDDVLGDAIDGGKQGAYRVGGVGGTGGALERILRDGFVVPEGNGFLMARFGAALVLADSDGLANDPLYPGVDPASPAAAARGALFSNGPAARGAFPRGTLEGARSAAEAEKRQSGTEEPAHLLLGAAFQASCDALVSRGAARTLREILYANATRQLYLRSPPPPPSRRRDIRSAATGTAAGAVAGTAVGTVAGTAAGTAVGLSATTRVVAARSDSFDPSIASNDTSRSLASAFVRWGAFAESLSSTALLYPQDIDAACLAAIAEATHAVASDPLRLSTGAASPVRGGAEARISRALGAARAASELAPGHPGCLAAQSKALLALGDGAAARSAAEAFVGAAPDSPHAHVLLARAHAAAGNWTAAAEQARRGYDLAIAQQRVLEFPVSSRSLAPSRVLFHALLQTARIAEAGKLLREAETVTAAVYEPAALSVAAHAAMAGEWVAELAATDFNATGYDDDLPAAAEAAGADPAENVAAFVGFGGSCIFCEGHPSGWAAEQEVEVAVAAIARAYTLAVASVRGARSNPAPTVPQLVQSLDSIAAQFPSAAAAARVARGVVEAEIALAPFLGARARGNSRGAPESEAETAAFDEAEALLAAAAGTEESALAGGASLLTIPAPPQPAAERLGEVVVARARIAWAAAAASAASAASAAAASTPSAGDGGTAGSPEATPIVAGPEAAALGARAVQWFERSLARHPGRLKSNLGLARAHAASNNVTEATAAYERVLAAASGSPDAPSLAFLGEAKEYIATHSAVFVSPVERPAGHGTVVLAVMLSACVLAGLAAGIKAALDRGEERARDAARGNELELRDALAGGSSVHDDPLDNVDDDLDHRDGSVVATRHVVDDPGPKPLPIDRV